jgi:hypothetical protein
MFKVAMLHTTTPAISSTEIHMHELPTYSRIFLESEDWEDISIAGRII